MLKLIEPEINKSKLRDVIDFEVDFIRKSYEHELSEKDELIADKDAVIAGMNVVIADKNKEIRLLKAKLAEKGIH